MSKKTAGHSRRKVVDLVTMGCSKNLVDSEQLAFQLRAAGYEVIHNSHDDDFDVAIVNTCGFIDAAKEESLHAILELLELKQQGRIGKVVVFGCLSQRYMDDLKAELPEVDAFIGNYDLQLILKSIADDIPVSPCRHGRFLDGPGHYAYLKVADGCDHNCAFCAIPLIKGPYLSRPAADIIDEARYLAQQGVKELMLVAQDLSYYGCDIDNRFHLPALVEQLADIPGIEWIRLHYLYPNYFPDRILDIMASNPKVCKYVDIPLQHASTRVLREMGRCCTKAEIVRLLDKIRNKVPNVAIRTTMLVGFPYEGERQFQELIEFVEKQRFDRLGVFEYSEEDGTAAANELNDIVPADEKLRRADVLMSLQSEISYDLNKQKIGHTFKTIIDGREGDYFIGRTEYDSVDVDNEVLIAATEDVQVGNFYDVKITSADEFDLYGVVDE